MLTPRSDDKNRVSELQRKGKEPLTFCSNNETMALAKDLRNAGLVNLKGGPLVFDPRRKLKVRRVPELTNIEEK